MQSYQRRLRDALRIIKKDDSQRKARESEKIARTQYRDRFQFRRQTTIANDSNQYSIWRCEEDSGDDYEPDRRRGKKSKKPRQTRLEKEEEKRLKKDCSKKRALSPHEVIVDEDEIESRPQTPGSRKRPKTISNDVFVTLKLESEQGRRFLKHMSEAHPDTHIDVCARNLAQQTTNLTISLNNLDVADDVFEDLPSARTLRSGRIRCEFTPRKRKASEIDQEENEEKVDIERSDQCREIVDEDLSVDKLDQCRDIVGQIPNIDTLNEFQEKVENESPTQPPQPPPQPIQGQQLGSDPAKVPLDEKPAETAAQFPSILPSVEPGSSEKHAIEIESDSDDVVITHTNTIRHPTTHSSRTPTTNPHFNNPINFKGTDPDACTFHRDFRNPILGTTTKHASKPAGGDQMCVTCALEYISIARCQVHRFTRLPPNPTIISDGGRAYVRHLYAPPQPSDETKHADVETRAQQLPNTKTCSLCPAPASYKCTSFQDCDRMLRPCVVPSSSFSPSPRPSSSLAHPHQQDSPTSPHQTDATATVGIQPPLQGCGLYTCEECQRLITDRCHGDVQRHRHTILRELERKPLGARVDVTFLFQHGHVWRSYFP